MAELSAPLFATHDGCETLTRLVINHLPDALRASLSRPAHPDASTS